jgi:hypothetical protein
MNIFKLIGELVVLYVLYNVVFNFIIPLYKASKQMKGTFNNMRDQQNAQQPTQKTNKEQAGKRNNEGDYIDYEEVK